VLFFDLSLGLAADFPADPLPVRAKAERDHPTPTARTGLVMDAVAVDVPAVVSVIEGDAVLAEP
jgi:hypothetical protein